MPTTRSARVHHRGLVRGPPGQLRQAGHLGLDHRADAHAVVLGARVNDARTSLGFDWSGIRPERSVTIRGSSRGGTSLISMLLRIDRLAAGRAAQPAAESRGHRNRRRDLGQPGQPRQRPAAVHDDVVPMRGRELGESGRRPARGHGRGQYEPASHGHQRAEGQPRLPVLPQPPAKHHDRPPAWHLPLRRLPSVAETGRTRQGSHPPAGSRASTIEPVRGSPGPGLSGRAWPWASATPSVGPARPAWPCLTA